MIKICTSDIVGKTPQRRTIMSDDLLLKTMAQNIAMRRKMLNLSQKELAAKLGITKESMSCIERGVRAPHLLRLQEIADHLQCTVLFLLGNDSPTVENRARVLAELLERLSPKNQEAVMAVVYATVEALRGEER